MIERMQRIEDLLADVCRRSGAIYDAPTVQEFAEMLRKRDFVLRDAPMGEAPNPLDGTRLWDNS